MVTEFNAPAWRAEILRRKHSTLQDSLVQARAKFIGMHCFQHANTPDWPYPNWGLDKKIFGAFWIPRSKGTFRISRNLHGYNVTLAYGHLLPAHAARLSDLIELVFGKYRLEPSRARWNFSEELAKQDYARESQLRVVIDELEKILLDKTILPAVEHMPAILLAAAPKTSKRRTEVAILQARIQEFESAVAQRFDDLQEQILNLQLKNETSHIG